MRRRNRRKRLRKKMRRILGRLRTSIGRILPNKKLMARNPSFIGGVVTLLIYFVVVFRKRGRSN